MSQSPCSDPPPLATVCLPSGPWPSVHITFSLRPHLRQSVYVRTTLSLPSGRRTLDEHGVCVAVTRGAAASAGAWTMGSRLASVWSALLSLPTSSCCSPYKAGTRPACHMEPILLTQPNCPGPRALTHGPFHFSSQPLSPVRSFPGRRGPWHPGFRGCLTEAAQQTLRDPGRSQTNLV